MADLGLENLPAKLAAACHCSDGEQLKADAEELDTLLHSMAWGGDRDALVLCAEVLLSSSDGLLAENGAIECSRRAHGASVQQRVVLVAVNFLPIFLAVR